MGCVGITVYIYSQFTLTEGGHVVTPRICITVLAHTPKVKVKFSRFLPTGKI